MLDTYKLHPALAFWQTGQFGGRGVFNESWDLFRDKDDLMQGMTVCVELVFGHDKIVRIAAKDINVTDTAGNDYHFEPLLQDWPSITRSYQVGTSSSQARSMAIALPSSLVKPYDLIRRIRMLAGIGEISLMFDGGNYDERIVLVRGQMDSGVTFSPSGGFIETSVTDPKSGVDVALPPYVISEEGFSDVPEPSIGERFPIIMSTMEYAPATFVSGASTGTTPEALVCEGSNTIEKVYVNGLEYSSTHYLYGWTTVHKSDDLGQPYTAIYFNKAAGVWDFTEGVYAKVVNNSESILNPIAQVRLLATSYSTLGKVGINEFLFARAESKIGNLSSRVCLNAGGSNNTSCLSFIESEFCASFPMISMVWQAGGYGPVVTDRTQVSQISGYLVSNQAPLMSRATIVQETAVTDIFNEFTLRYSYNAMEDVYEGVSTRTSSNSLICKASQEMVGYNPCDVIDSVWIHDSKTAEYVLDWLVAHTSAPSYYVEYQCNPSIFFRFSLGDNIALTDNEFSWSEQIATVETLSLAKGYCTIGLRVWSIFTNIGGGANTFETSVGL